MNQTSKEESKEETLKMTPMINFTLNKYLGTWYEQARTKAVPHQKPDDTDVKAEYGMQEGGNISIKNSRMRDGKPGFITGYAYPKGKADVANLKIIFGDSWWKRLIMRGEYNVLDTDYVNHSIVYRDSQKIWILHRQQNPPKEEIQGLIDKANIAFSIKNDDWLWTKKSN